MRKFKYVFAASILASSMVVTPVFADDVSNLQNSKSAAQSEVNSLQDELQALIEKMNDLEEKLMSTGQQIVQAQDDLVVAEEKEHQQYEDMKKRIKYMYEAGNTSAIETLISAENFSDLLNKAEYVQNVHSYDRKQLQEYVETKQQISDLKDSLEKDQKELESKQAEYEKQGDNLNNLITSKSAEVANLDSEIQQQKRQQRKQRRERQKKQQKRLQKRLQRSSRHLQLITVLHLTEIILQQATIQRATKITQVIQRDHRDHRDHQVIIQAAIQQADRMQMVARS